MKRAAMILAALLILGGCSGKPESEPIPAETTQTEAATTTQTTAAALS